MIFSRTSRLSLREFCPENELSARKFQNRATLLHRKAIVSGVRRFEFRLQLDYPRVGLESPSLSDARPDPLQEIVDQAPAPTPACGGCGSEGFGREQCGSRFVCFFHSKEN